MTWLTVHYEIIPEDKYPFLVQVLCCVGGGEGKAIWKVTWSKTLHPGESQDIADSPVLPGFGDVFHVQFLTTPDNPVTPVGMVFYATAFKKGDKVTVTADRQIVVSR
jgi:hypothetical protein